MKSWSLIVSYAANGTRHDSTDAEHVTVRVFFPLRNGFVATAGECNVRPALLALCPRFCLPNYLPLWLFKPVTHTSTFINRKLPRHVARHMGGDTMVSHRCPRPISPCRRVTPRTRNKRYLHASSRFKTEVWPILCKGPDSKYFRACWPRSLTLCLCGVRAATDRTEMHEGG